MSAEILFLAHRIPYPPNRGDKIRSWHLLRAMTRIAPVHVCALWDDARDLAHVSFLRTIAASVHVEPATLSRAAAIGIALLTGQPASVAACRSRAMRDAVRGVLESRPIKTIFTFSGQMAQFVPPSGGSHRFVMDFVDMDSEKFAAFGGVAHREEARRLFAYELAVARRADLSLFVSEAEAHLFRSKTRLGVDKVGVLENGIDLVEYDPTLKHESIGLASGDLIVFTGQMDYRPNIEAVRFFATEVLPKVRQERFDARFAIVGRSPTASVRALAALPGVVVTGEVPDTRGWLAAADVVVSPLKIARGVQNKVLEAMAMGKAVVVSRAAAEGIDATEMLVADTAQAQATAIIGLLRDPGTARRLGQCARKRMEARYGWDSRLGNLRSVLDLGGCGSVLA